MTAQLEYQGNPMRFEPTRVLCLQSHGPLDSDEPNDANILSLLADGYAVFVELQPGDGTRYGLLLTEAVSGINVMRIGAPARGGSVYVSLGRPAIVEEDCAPLAPSNPWSRVFFAWWLNALVHVDERVTT
jgi:hypothetical protein